MTDDKLYTNLSASTTRAELTYHIEQTRFITSKTDKHYPLSFKDNFWLDYWNISHQQQFFPELP